MYSVTKSYRDLPAAHRQPKHDGHCRYVHGHNWGFDITFAAKELDENGFVIDVGKLKEVKLYLEHMFDHTLLINLNDPKRELFEELHEEGLVDLRIVNNCGMEMLASLVSDHVQLLMDQIVKGRIVSVIKVVCLEDAKNVATYSKP